MRRLPPSRPSAHHLQEPGQVGSGKLFPLPLPSVPSSTQARGGEDADQSPGPPPVPPRQRSGQKRRLAGEDTRQRSAAGPLSPSEGRFAPASPPRQRRPPENGCRWSRAFPGRAAAAERASGPSSRAKRFQPGGRIRVEERDASKAEGRLPLPLNLSSCCGSRIKTCSVFAMLAPAPPPPPRRRLKHQAGPEGKRSKRQ